MIKNQEIGLKKVLYGASESGWPSLAMLLFCFFYFLFILFIFLLLFFYERFSILARTVAVQ